MRKTSESDRPKGSRRWVRPLVIALAACVIAFSGWSLAEYTQGVDPLGWLTSQDALQTTADSSADGNAGSAADAGGTDAPQDDANDGSVAAQDAAGDATSTDAGDASTSGQGATAAAGEDDASSSSAQAGSDGGSSAQGGGQTSPSTTSTSASAPAASGSQASSQGSGQAQQAQTISVSVTIDGSPAGGSRHGSTVELAPGSNVYDALVAADANINARDTVYGIYVAAIDGLAEKDHGSMSGWVYAVNGVEPNTACSNYVLSSGDTVVWTYVNVE